MPIMPDILLNERPDSFHRQAIMLRFDFNPSPDSCIKTYNTRGGGEGLKATVDTTCTVMSSGQCMSSRHLWIRIFCFLI